MTVTTQEFARTSPYNNYAWCTRCGEYIPRKDLETDILGRPVCPFCGHVVRVKPRHKNHKSTLNAIKKKPAMESNTPSMNAMESTSMNASVSSI